MTQYESWGRWPRGEARVVRRPSTRAALQAALAQADTFLPVGNLRSQGDSCLNNGGVLLDMRNFNHFLEFDPLTGILRCEAGVTLAEILSLVVPQGWFLPVTPGTKYITVGGAIANDVHGKNHPAAGSFGHHVRRFELMRSTGDSVVCSPTENTALYAATIGGLGLTGAITWAEVALRPLQSTYITQQARRFLNIRDLFRIVESHEVAGEYWVTWLDCLARGENLGRGVVQVGDHASGKGELAHFTAASARLSVPFDAPAWCTGRAAVEAFNSWRFLTAARGRAAHQIKLEKFFYPLDGVEQWNRLYGRRGFLQYQCVVPPANGAAVIEELLARIAATGLASFLSTIKFFGDKPPAGLLSFPRPGVCLAVDFANTGPRLLKLLDELDTIVKAAGGAVYPAKDSRMSPAMFRHSFPRWQEFSRHVDPAFSSSFWRRINA